MYQVLMSDFSLGNDISSDNFYIKIELYKINILQSVKNLKQILSEIKNYEILENKVPDLYINEHYKITRNTIDGLEILIGNYTKDDCICYQVSIQININ